MTTWQPDWPSLNEVAAAYAAASPLPAAIAKVTPPGSVVFTGLQAELSTILAGAPAELPGGVVIAVDTLSVPAGTTEIPAAGVVIVARSIEVDGGGSATLEIPWAGGAGLQAVTAGVVGDVAVSLQDGGGNPLAGGPASLVTQSAVAVPQVLTVTPAAPGAVSVANDTASVADELHSDWSVLELEQSFNAAGVLLDQGAAAAPLATEMLRWVTAGCSALVTEQSSYPSVDWSDIASLETNALGLLTFTQAALSDSTYVPVLSAAFYDAQVNSLLGVAQTYSSNIALLAQEQNLDQLLGQFAGTLGTITSDAEQPLLESLRNLNSQSAAAQEQLGNDAAQLQGIAAQLPALQSALTSAIESEQQREILESGLDTFFTIVNLYVGCATIILGDPTLMTSLDAKSVTSALQLVAELSKAGEGAITGIINGGSSALGAPPSAATAAAAEQGAEAMMGSLAALGAQVYALWLVVNEASSSGKVNCSAPLMKALNTNLDLSSLSIGGLDPATYWSATVAQVEGSVQPFQTGSTQAAADAYLEAVQLSASYGTGVADEQMQLLNLYTQGLAAYNRLCAVYQAEGQWNSLQASLASQAQQLQAAIGILQAGYAEVTRSIALAVESYRAAFFYQWMQPSTVEVNASMDYLQLYQACQAAIADLQNVLAGTPTGTVKPSQTFTGVKYTVTGGDGALFTEVAGRGQAQWSIALDDTVLSGQLNGNTAIFLSNAQIVLVGAEQAAEVELEVATSGHYENAWNGSSARFVSQPISMVVDYLPQDLPNFITSWAFASPAAYTKPTPYTDWTLTVQQGDWQDVSAIELTLAGVFLQDTA